MLEVVEIHYIRHEVNQKGKSYAEVARQVQHDPRTIKKYADQEEFLQKQKQTREAPVMDRVKPIIDEWIREDLKLKKKYQRTAQRMFDLLVKEHDFKGKARNFKIKNYHPTFTEEELDIYYSTAIKNWEEFCRDIYFYSPEGAIMKEYLHNLPDDSRYK